MFASATVRTSAMRPPAATHAQSGRGRHDEPKIGPSGGPIGRYPPTRGLSNLRAAARGDPNARSPWWPSPASAACVSSEPPQSTKFLPHVSRVCPSSASNARPTRAASFGFLLAAFMTAIVPWEVRTILKIRPRSAHCTSIEWPVLAGQRVSVAGIKARNLTCSTARHRVAQLVAHKRKAVDSVVQRTSI